MFSMFGGGGGSRSQGSKIKKNKAVKKELRISLENAYKGDCIKIAHSCTRNCEVCDGKGGSSVSVCSLCKGKGVIEKMVMLGPGMYQHVRSHCGECRGEGKTVSEKDKCKKCKGQKVMEVKKTLEVPIEVLCIFIVVCFIHLYDRKEYPTNIPSKCIARETKW